MATKFFSQLREVIVVLILVLFPAVDLLDLPPILVPPLPSFPVSAGEEWGLIFKAVSGKHGTQLNSPTPYDIYINPGGRNEDVAEARRLDASYAGHYKRSDIDNWESLNVQEVKISLYNSSGRELRSFFFDGDGSTKSNWMSKSRYIGSSYTDIVSEPQNYFSIAGYNVRSDRRFYINRNYGGCPKDNGWLVMLQFDERCTWEKNPGYLPAFLYSKLSTYANWNNEEDIGEADIFAVFIKDNPAVCSPPCLNGAECTSNDVCSCLPGYTGNRCQSPICQQPCLNGGTCSRPNGCSCTNEYTGNRCDIAICSPPCLNEGFCQSPNFCHCSSGYNGSLCQNAICSPPCVNGGTCLAPSVCNCTFGYRGNICQFLTARCPNDVEVSNDPGQSGAAVTWVDVMADVTDVTTTQSSGDFFSIGSTVVNYEVPGGSTCTFTVTVYDTEKPVIKCPANSTAYIETGSMVPVYWDLPVFTDNSKEAITLYRHRESGSNFSIGVATVSFLAIDNSGNRAMCSFEVTVIARCPKETINSTDGLLSWPPTEVTSTAESDQRCPVTSERRNYARAIRECQPGINTVAVWAEPQITPCGALVRVDEEDLSEIPITDFNVEEVSSTLADVTLNSYIAGQEIDSVAVDETLNNIVDVQSSSEAVTRHIIETIDILLAADHKPVNNTSYSDIAKGIVKSLEKQIVRTVEDNNSFRLVMPRIAVDAHTVREGGIRNGWSFAAMDDGTDPFFNDHLISTFSGENETLANIASSISLPPGVFEMAENDSGIKVSFILYGNDRLFQSGRTNNITQNRIPISGQIISATLHDVEISNLTEPVVIQMNMNQANTSGNPLNAEDFACVFWGEERSDWSVDGCELVSHTRRGATCHCDHLTNFAIFVARQEFSEEDYDIFALDRIGCIVSILAVCSTLLKRLICRRQPPTVPRKILIQLFLSMVALYLVFLFGIGQNPYCIATGALLHFLFLTTMFLIGMEGWNLYNACTLKSTTNRCCSKFEIFASCVAWGLPTVILTLAIYFGADDYVSYDHCFLAINNIFFFGLMLPIGIISLHNIAVFGLLVRRLSLSHSYETSSQSKAREVAKRVQNIKVIAVLFCLTWVFGFMSIYYPKFIFDLIFCTCNSLQGAMIFLLYCLCEGGACIRKRSDDRSDNVDATANQNTVTYVNQVFSQDMNKNNYE